MWSYIYLITSISYTYLHRVLNCSLFASGLFHIFKDISWDWICHTTHIPVWTKQLIYHTACSHELCYMAEFSRMGCVGGEFNCLPHAPGQEGWSCSSTFPAEMGLCGRLKGYSWPCLQFLDLVHQQRCSIAQPMCSLGPAICKPMLNSAAWDVPQAHYSSMILAAVMQWCSWLLLSLALPPALAASSQWCICI